ncbi:MAG TPA: RNA 2',3'-cyclic phosphodiesterase [bacterium]
MRAFIAIETPAIIRDKVSKIIEAGKAKRMSIKWVAYENLHITLKFLGEISDAAKDEIIPAIAETVASVPQFMVQVSGIGCFPGPRQPRVLWAGVIQGGDSMIAIAENLDRNMARFGCKIEDKKFHPHLTFGRVKTFCPVDDILKQELHTDAFMVDRITLFKSTLRPEGPKYDPVRTFTLAP